MPEYALFRVLMRMARREPIYLVASTVRLALGLRTLHQPPPFSHWDRLLVLRGMSAQVQRLPLKLAGFLELRRDGMRQEVGHLSAAGSLLS